MILKAGIYRFIDNPDVSKTFNQIIPLTGTIGDKTATVGGFAVAKVGNYNQLQLVDINGSGFGSAIYFYDPNVYEYVWADNVLGISATKDEIKTHTITTDTEVDDTFGTWYIASTNYNEVNPPEAKPLAEITYNGETIAQLNAGETCTIKCAENRMITDVVIKINS